MSEEALVIRVDASDLITAGDALDQLADKADTTEQSTDRIGAAFARQADAIATASDGYDKLTVMQRAYADGNDAVIAAYEAEYAIALRKFTDEAQGYDNLTAAQRRYLDAAVEAQAVTQATAAATAALTSSQTSLASSGKSVVDSMANIRAASTAQYSAFQSLAESQRIVASQNASMTASTKQQEQEFIGLSTAAQKVLDRYDPLGTKLRSLQADMALLNTEIARGAGDSTSVTASLGAISKINTEVAQVQGLMAAAGVAGSDGMEKIATGATHAATGTSLATRELITMGREAINGNFTRLPGSFLLFSQAIGISLAQMLTFAAVFGPIIAAIGLLSYAIIKGASDLKAMDNAIESTGNYADTSVTQIKAMAQSISDAGTLTVGTAQEIVTKLVASGRYSSDNIALLTKLTENYAAVTGESAAKAADALTKMFEDPAKASETLNDQYHYLSIAQLDQIKNLQEQGEKQAAVTLALKEFDDRLPQHIANIGLLPKVWNDAAKGISDYVAGLKSAVNYFGSDQFNADVLRRKIFTMVSQQNVDPHDPAVQALGAQLAALDAKIAKQGASNALQAQESQDLARNADGWKLVTKNATDYQRQLLENEKIAIQKVFPGDTTTGIEDPVLAAKQLDALQQVQKKIDAIGKSKGPDLFANFMKEMANQSAAADLALATLSNTVDSKTTPALAALNKLEASDVWKTYSEARKQQAIDEATIVSSKQAALAVETANAKVIDSTTKTIDAQSVSLVAQAAKYDDETRSLVLYGKATNDSAVAALQSALANGKLGEALAEQEKQFPGIAEAWTRILTAQAAATDAARNHEQAIASLTATLDKAQQSYDKTTASLDKQADKLQEQAKNLGLTREQIDANKLSEDALTLSTDQQALAQAQADAALGTQTQSYVDSMAARVEADKRVLDAQHALMDKQAIVDTDKAWGSVFNSLTNDAVSFFQDFEKNGSSAFKKTGQDLVNQITSALIKLGTQQLILAVTANTSLAGAAQQAFAGSSSGTTNLLGNLLGIGGRNTPAAPAIDTSALQLSVNTAKDSIDTFAQNLALVKASSDSLQLSEGAAKSTVDMFSQSVNTSSSSFSQSMKIASDGFKDATDSVAPSTANLVASFGNVTTADVQLQAATTTLASAMSRTAPQIDNISSDFTNTSLSTQNLMSSVTNVSLGMGSFQTGLDGATTAAAATGVGLVDLSNSAPHATNSLIAMANSGIRTNDGLSTFTDGLNPAATGLSNVASSSGSVVSGFAGVLQGLGGFVNSLFGLLGGGGGAGSVGSALNNGSNLLTSGSRLFGSSSNFLGNAAGSFATSGVGQAIGLSESVGGASGIAADAIGGVAGPTSAADLALTGAGTALTAGATALGAAIPYIGIAIAAASALGLFNKKPSETRGQFQVSQGTTGFEDNAYTASSVGNLGFNDANTQQFSGQAAQVFNKVVGGAIDAFATRFSPEQSARLATVLQGTTFASESGTFTTEDFLQKYGGQVLQQVVTAAFNVLDPALGSVAANFKGTADEVATFSNSLLSIYDATKQIGNVDFTTKIDAALGDATQATADKVLALVTIVSQFGDSITGLGPKIEALNPANMLAFVDALGGAQTAVQTMTFIDTNFTTSAQKASTAAALLNTDFAGLGLAVPKTHQGFLDLLNSIDVATPAGAKLYASIAAFAPLFVQVSGTADQMAAAFANVVTTINNTRLGLSGVTGAAADTANRNTLIDQFVSEAGHEWAKTLLASVGYQGFTTNLESIDTSPGGDLSRYSAADQTLISNILSTQLQIQNSQQTSVSSGSSGSSSSGAAPPAYKGPTFDSVMNQIAAVTAQSANFGTTLSTQFAIIGDALTKAKAALRIAPSAEASKLVLDLTNENTLIAKEIANYATYTAQYDTARAEALVKLEEWDDAQKKIFAGMPASLAAVDVVFKQQWTAIVDGTQAGVNSTIAAMQQIADYLKGLQLSSTLSPLTPTQKLNQAQSAFATDLTKAQGGDAAALAKITQDADAYLTQARDFYASSASYTGIFNTVTAALGKLAGTQPNGAPADSNTAIVAALPTGGAALASSADVATVTAAVTALTTTVAASPAPTIAVAAGGATTVDNSTSTAIEQTMLAVDQSVDNSVRSLATSITSNALTQTSILNAIDNSLKTISTSFASTSSATTATSIQNVIQTYNQLSDSVTPQVIDYLAALTRLATLEATATPSTQPAVTTVLSPLLDAALPANGSKLVSSDDLAKQTTDLKTILAQLISALATANTKTTQAATATLKQSLSAIQEELSRIH